MIGAVFFRRKQFDSSVDWCIVGLGNPGREYDGSRHNIGFAVLDYIADKTGVAVKKLKWKGLYGTGVIGGQRVLLLKPQTFMNNSGESVRDLLSFYKLPPERCILLFDDISLPPGNIRIRRKGSDGGHNGVKSILYLTGSDQFPRIKIGVGQKPRPDVDLAAWVLARFPKDALPAMRQAAEKAYQSVLLMLQGQTEQAMNRYNS